MEPILTQHMKGGEWIITAGEPGGTFTPEDFSEEQQMVKEACMQFVQTEVIPVVEVDGRPIGSGKPGEITMRLRQLYWQTHTDPRYCVPVYP